MVPGSHQQAGFQPAEQGQVVHAAGPQPRRALDERVLGDGRHQLLGVAQQVAHAPGDHLGVEPGLVLGGAQHQPVVRPGHQVDRLAADQAADGARGRPQRTVPVPQPQDLALHRPDQAVQPGAQPGAPGPGREHRDITVHCGPIGQQHLAGQGFRDLHRDELHPGGGARGAQRGQQQPVVHGQVVRHVQSTADRGPERGLQPPHLARGQLTHFPAQRGQVLGQPDQLVPVGRVHPDRQRARGVQPGIPASRGVQPRGELRPAPQRGRAQREQVLLPGQASVTGASMPPATQDEPVPGAGSTTRTANPAVASCQAMDRPITPPPTTTTAFDTNLTLPAPA